MDEDISLIAEPNTKELTSAVAEATSLRSSYLRAWGQFVENTIGPRRLYERKLWVTMRVTMRVTVNYLDN